MNSRKKSQRAWESILSGLEPGETASVDKSTVPHPLDAGGHRTSTWPTGQVADFGLPARNGQPPLVVREHDEKFEAFIDAVRLSPSVIEAAESNPTMAMYLGGALMGGAIGSSVTQRREGTLIGAGVGLLLAAMIDSSVSGSRRRHR